MSDFISELHILGDCYNLFDIGDEYIIPLYQRSFAWEDKQLIQLIEDINDITDGTKYYIGSLIVSRQGNKYEVIDGQQRLTSIYILLNCLGYNICNNLTFSCREKSNYTLKNIQKLIQMNSSKIDMERIEPSIQNGVKILMQVMSREGFDKKQFCEKLARVVVYRIEVPDNTDLNRYFEIMNTRGEQLEQQDILKASLMSNLQDEKDKELFAKIWDACSDMTGYVQMHFDSRNNKIRKAFFGRYLNDIPQDSWSEYKECVKVNSINTTGYTIQEIIGDNFSIDTDNGYIDDDVRVRFNSIIEFPHFLIHTLKVFITIKGIKHKDNREKIIDDLIDDKKIIDSFRKVISHGVTSSCVISHNKESFSKEFILCLLKTRFLFDRYIIKREYVNENTDGEWSLKELYFSEDQPNNRPYYRNTRFVRKNEWEQDKRSNIRNKNNIMLQSALRVSYTSPKAMHWITKILIWLSENYYANSLQDTTSFSTLIEKIAQNAVIEQFFNVCEDRTYALGINTPHIVFNYLDYLLWKSDNESDKKSMYRDFTFEFRNSVEHWYPRNPSEGSFERWEDGEDIKDNVDTFGNLCIIHRNINSKFSNMSPEAKNSTYKDIIQKGSLKLRIMSQLTEEYKGRDASLYWKKTLYKKHENDMIEKLRNACFPRGK